MADFDPTNMTPAEVISQLTPTNAEPPYGSIAARWAGANEPDQPEPSWVQLRRGGRGASAGPQDPHQAAYADADAADRAADSNLNLFLKARTLHDTAAFHHDLHSIDATDPDAEQQVLKSLQDNPYAQPNPTYMSIFQGAREKHIKTLAETSRNNFEGPAQQAYDEFYQAHGDPYAATTHAKQTQMHEDFLHKAAAAGLIDLNNPADLPMTQNEFGRTHPDYNAIENNIYTRAGKQAQAKTGLPEQRLMLTGANSVIKAFEANAQNAKDPAKKAEYDHAVATRNQIMSGGTGTTAPTSAAAFIP